MMLLSMLSLLVSCFLLAPWPTHSYLINSFLGYRDGRLSSNTALSDGAKNDLVSTSPFTLSNGLWRLDLHLERPHCKTMSSSALIRFVESDGYEPPQGNVLVEQDFNHFFRKHDDGYSGQWRLIEDEDGRKDGLWVCKFWTMFIFSLLSSGNDLLLWC